MDYEKLREKLKWVLHPLRNISGINQKQDLIDKIVAAVEECDVTPAKAKDVVPSLE